MMKQMLRVTLALMAITLTTSAATNPLTEKWTTPFGVPPFERIQPEHFTPAIEEGLKIHKAEAGKIVANRKPATFENTIAALELSGRLLDRTATILNNLTGAHTNEALDKIDLEISPRLTRHGNEILQNAALYKRVRAVFDQRDQGKLTPEQRRLVERIHIRFVRAGAHLSPAQRQRLAAIDERRTTLATKFNQNLLADTKAFVLVLETEEEMAGLPDFVRDMARAEAKSRGMSKAGVITISRSSYEPFMKFSQRRDLREKLFRAWTLRGDNGNQFDNKAIITETVSLRAERAQLLGYPTFAHFSLDDSMAKKPEAAMELMLRVWKPAREQALHDRDQLQQMMSSEAGAAGAKIAPWDWQYYSEKVRQAQFNLSETEIKPYFQLDRMIEAAFYTAGRLYGLQFSERQDLKGWHPDVRAWEVKDAQGQHVGIFFGDYYARPSKGGGAWMNAYRDQEKLIGIVTPIIANHCNFNKPEPGKPALLSFDDARTLFHEFGHALHGLLSNVTYPTLSGTAVPRDFVELPSQINEHWVGTDEVLGKFARHYQTGQPMPAALLTKIRNAAKFDQGFATVEFVASALVDMEFHLLQNAKAVDPVAFEKQILTKIGMPDEITMRHRSPHFSHIFGGGYAAGYYSYLWAEVLDADGFEAFKESGDEFNPELARRFRENILAVGNSRDLMEAYRQFRGKDPAVEPLLRKRGLAPAK